MHLTVAILGGGPWGAPTHLHNNNHKSPHPRTIILHKKVTPSRATVASHEASGNKVQYFKELPN